MTAATNRIRQPIFLVRSDHCGSTPHLRIIQATVTPTPYPIASEMPVATPCRYHARGNRDGLIDQVKKTRAKASPTGCSVLQ